MLWEDEIIVSTYKEKSKWPTKDIIWGNDKTIPFVCNVWCVQYTYVG